MSTPTSQLNPALPEYPENDPRHNWTYEQRLIWANPYGGGPISDYLSRLGVSNTQENVDTAARSSVSYKAPAPQPAPVTKPTPAPTTDTITPNLSVNPDTHVNPVYMKGSWAYYGYGNLQNEYENPNLEEGSYITKITKTPFGLSYETSSPKLDAERAASQRFWNNQGFLQYAGVLNPVEIPSGKHIDAVVKTESGYQIQFGDAANEEYWQSVGLPEYANKFEKPSLSEEQASKGLYIKAVKAGDTGPQIVLGNKSSEQFWSNLGPEYSKYGELGYEPITPPEGYTLKDIAGVSETPQGLSFQFQKPIEAKMQEEQVLEEPVNPAIAQMQNISRMFNQSGVREYNSAVVGKATEFNALPLSTKISELQRMMPGALPKEVSTSQITDITFDPSSMQIKYSYMPNASPKGAMAESTTNINQSPASSEVLSSKNFYNTLAVQTGRPEIAQYGGKYAPLSPAQLGELNKQGYGITGVSEVEVPMVGPLLPGQTRPTIKQLSFELTPLNNKPTAQPVKTDASKPLPFPLSLAGPAKEMGNNPIVKAFTNSPLIKTLTGRELSFEQKKTASLASPLTTPISNLPVEQRQTALEIAGIGLTAVVAPQLLPISTKAILAGGALNVGISEAVSYGVTGKPLPTKEILPAMLLGETFVVVGTVGMMGAAKIAPKLATTVGGRMITNATLGAGAGYVLSGGNPQAAGEGALFGAAMSLGSDVIATPIINKIRTVIPERYGGVIEAKPSEPVMGKMGEPVDTYTTKPISVLDNKPVRVIADVTANPVGFEGVTKESLVREYVGNEVPTGHATLHPEGFNLGKGQSTVLKGFPEEGAGTRAEKELFHFYSAPGSKEQVNVYGGYAGVGEGYSGEQPKLIFGGKPTALVTTKTAIPEETLRFKGESESAFLTRRANLSGKTGIAEETLLGYSQERQFTTPAAYTRGEEQLPGSKFLSEGKVATVQIQQKPQGFIGKIPIIRTMFSKFTNMDIIKGSYKPTIDVAPEEAILDVGAYGSSYRKSINVSSPVMVAPPSIILSTTTEKELGSMGNKNISSRASQLKTPSSQSASSPSSKEISKGSIKVTSNIPSVFSQPSQPQRPYSPSYREQPSSPFSKAASVFSMLSTPSFDLEPIIELPSGKSFGSKVSVPSIPSTPSSPSISSHVSMPSIPSVPSKPSMPSVPSTPSKPSMASSYVRSSSLTSLQASPQEMFNRKPPMMKRGSKKQGSGVFLWEFPVVEPQELMEIKGENKNGTNSRFTLRTNIRFSRGSILRDR